MNVSYLKHAKVLLNSDHPNIVRVNTKYSICTGSLIHPRIVLTAAHCFIHAEGVANIDFVINKNNQIESKKINVKKIITHQNYEPINGSESDLAILILKSSANLPKNNYSKLANDYSKLKAGDEVLLIGFGLDENNSNSGIKRKKNVKRLKSYMCNASDDYLRLEVGGNGGDSGGPVLITNELNKQVQVGVLASGTTGFLGMCYGTNYVDLSLYTNWIQELTGYTHQSTKEEVLNSLIENSLI